MSTSYTTSSNRLAAKALLTGGRYPTVYAVYRWLEGYSGSVSDSNTELAEALGLSPEHLRRCVKLLERMGLLVAVYAENGDKASRQLVVPKQLDPWAIRTLKGLCEGRIVIDFQRVCLVHESGAVIDCSTRTFAMNEGGPLPFVLPGSELDRQLAVLSAGVVSAAAAAVEPPPAARASTGGASAVRGTIGGSSFSVSNDQSEPKSTALLSNSTALRQGTTTPLDTPPTPAGPRKRTRSTFSTWAPERQRQVTQLIDEWRERFDYHDCKHTEPRRAKVNARLDEGYTLEQLRTVLDMAVGDKFWRGQNDRNTPYDDIIHLFRNAARVDQFLAKSRRNLTGGGPVDRVRSDLAAGHGPLDEERF